MDNQFKDIEEKLRKLEKKNRNVKQSFENSDQSYGKSGARAGIDFALTIFVSMLGGVFLDKYFETQMVFLIVFMILGSAAAFYNLYRYSVGVENEIGFSRLRDQEKKDNNESTKEE